MYLYFKRWPRCAVAAIVGATVVGGIISSSAQADAADEAAGVQRDAAATAAGVQRDASDAAIKQRQQQFDVMRGLLQPWVDQGNTARTGQSDILGLNGNGPQGAAIDALKQGPQFGALKTTGEQAILSNASATGGLRGGNVNGALAQYDQTLLSAIIDQQYQRLTGVANTGQNAAAGVGSAAINVGNANAGDITTAGTATADSINSGAAATAGGILSGARATTGLVNSAINAAGVVAGSRAGTPTYTPPPSVPYAVGGFSGGPVFA